MPPRLDRADARGDERRRDTPARLAGYPNVVLPATEWALPKRLEPAAVRDTVTRLLPRSRRLIGLEALDDLAISRDDIGREHRRAVFDTRLEYEATGETVDGLVIAEGVGIGLFGRHAVAIAAALDGWVPEVLGFEDGVLYQFLARPRGARSGRAGGRSRLRVRAAAIAPRSVGRFARALRSPYRDRGRGRDGRWSVRAGRERRAHSLRAATRTPPARRRASRRSSTATSRAPCGSPPVRPPTPLLGARSTSPTRSPIVSSSATTRSTTSRARSTTIRSPTGG